MNPSLRSEVEPFHVMQVLRQVALRQASHGDVVLLCVGQPATPAPAPAREAAVAALRREVLGYTETAGVLPLRRAIADLYRRRHGLEVSPDDVVVTTGSSGGFSTLLLAALDPGQTVAMTNPGYPAYRNTIEALGLRVLDLDCGHDTRFQPTAAMLDALPSRPDALVVASPANPTGTVIDAAELARIARWCEASGCLLISDEIYHRIEFGDAATSSAWQTSRQAVVLGSVSKYFSMTGYRLGWLLVDEPLRSRIDLLQGNLAICAPTISQVAAIGALSEEAQPELDAHVARYAENRDVLLRRLPELGITDFAPPDGAFYAYCDVSHLTRDSLTWCADVLARTGVALAPGVDFDRVHGSHTVRLSFCGSTDDLNEGLDRLVAVLA
ncbi:aminotransferase class I/II-fold pyridoxal phosphate-dependent enzyme [Nigerium sp.]|uniref:pyridoxal phosphate-dependent aminotransferase n=1 Tax=Nigerium sp. TaxID=2042655 RepID=UPI003221B20B